MSSEQSFDRPRTQIAVRLSLIVGLCGFAFMVASAPSANNSADDVSLSADHGYVLIRITMNTRFEIADRDRLVFKSYDAGKSFSIRIKTPYSAGVNSYVSLISVAEGHYFCDQYLPEMRSGKGWRDSSMPRPCPRTRITALSAHDIFEVKSGVVNFVGDWDVTSILSWTRSAEYPEMDVSYDMATIKKSTVLFPEQLGKYEVFVSYKGKKSVSLNDLAELLKQNSRSDDE